MIFFPPDINVGCFVQTRILFYIYAFQRGVCIHYASFSFSIYFQVKKLLKTVSAGSDLYLQYDIRQKALKLTANR